MNGAIAELSASIINRPNNTRKITIGISHHFFLSLKKSQNSLIIDILLITNFFYSGLISVLSFITGFVAIFFIFYNPVTVFIF